jgi:hypothetical protein
VKRGGYDTPSAHAEAVAAESGGVSAGALSALALRNPSIYAVRPSRIPPQLSNAGSRPSRHSSIRASAGWIGGASTPSMSARLGPRVNLVVRAGSFAGLLRPLRNHPWRGGRRPYRFRSSPPRSRYHRTVRESGQRFSNSWASSRAPMIAFTGSASFPVWTTSSAWLWHRSGWGGHSCRPDRPTSAPLPDRKIRGNSSRMSRHSELWRFPIPPQRNTRPPRRFPRGE